MVSRGFCCRTWTMRSSASYPSSWTSARSVAATVAAPVGERPGGRLLSADQAPMPVRDWPSVSASLAGARREPGRGDPVGLDVGQPVQAGRRGAGGPRSWPPLPNLSGPRSTPPHPGRLGIPCLARPGGAHAAQDGLGRWLDEPGTQRRNLVRYFLKWTSERQLTRKLAVPSVPRQQPADPLDDEGTLPTSTAVPDRRRAAGRRPGCRRTDPAVWAAHRAHPAPHRRPVHARGQARLPGRRPVPDPPVTPAGEAPAVPGLRPPGRLAVPRAQRGLRWLFPGLVSCQPIANHALTPDSPAMASTSGPPATVRSPPSRPTCPSWPTCSACISTPARARSTSTAARPASARRRSRCQRNTEPVALVVPGARIQLIVRGLLLGERGGYKRHRGAVRPAGAATNRNGAWRAAAGTSPPSSGSRSACSSRRPMRPGQPRRGRRRQRDDHRAVAVPRAGAGRNPAPGPHSLPVRASAALSYHPPDAVAARSSGPAW